MNWKTKKIGMHLTEYLHPDFEALVNSADQFIVCSQFDQDPSKGRKTEVSKCLTGEVLFAMCQNEAIKIKMIIDSSD